MTFHASEMKRACLTFAALAVMVSVASAADLTNAVPTAATNAVPFTGTNTAPVTSAPAAMPATKAAVPSAALNYEAFSMIADRNVFNQSRFPRSSSGSPNTNVVRRTPKIDSITLVGTMDYQKGKLAFFDGSSSQFKKAVKVGDSVGSFKLVDVAPNMVKLSGEKLEMELKIGQALRREDDGEWQVSSLSVIGSAVAAVGGLSTGGDKPAGSDGATGASAASGSGGSADDALKRLMEKRAKETNE